MPNKRRGAEQGPQTAASQTQGEDPSRPSLSGSPILWFLAGLGCVAVIGLAAILGFLLFLLPGQHRDVSVSGTIAAVEVSPTVAMTIEGRVPSAAPSAAPTNMPSVEPRQSPTTTPVPTYTPEATPSSPPAETRLPEPSPTIPAATAPPDAPAVRLNMIAFTSMLDGQKEIYVMDADGGNLTRLTNHPAEDLLPAWSPDGSQIAFVSDRDGNPEIYVMNSDGSGLRRLTNDPGPDYDPAWSPDGLQIAFDTERDVPIRADIWIMNVDGTGAFNLHPFGRHPSWSPDGRQLVALFRFDSAMHLGVMPVDGGSEPVPLLQSGMNNFPDWSPDGSRIVFDSAGAPGTSDIMVINANGSNLINLTNSRDVVNVAPTWSPSGQEIVFASDRDGNSEIYVMNADGSGLTRLTSTGVWNMYPSWSP